MISYKGWCNSITSTNTSTSTNTNTNSSSSDMKQYYLQVYKYNCNDKLMVTWNNCNHSTVEAETDEAQFHHSAWHHESTVSAATLGGQSTYCKTQSGICTCSMGMIWLSSSRVWTYLTLSMNFTLHKTPATSYRKQSSGFVMISACSWISLPPIITLSACRLVKIIN